MARKALLVGLNHYPDPENNLKGCVNDVLLMSKLLQEAFGFDEPKNIRLLTDERATTARITQHLAWLVGDATPGDVLVFHYSGHGAQVRDRHGDELDDGLDEIICPYDLDWDDPFTDDDLHEIIKDVPAGANLTVVLDCCHSGTGLREIFRPPVPLRAKCLLPPPDIRHRANPLIEDLGENRRLTMTRAATALPIRRFAARTAAAGAILIAGCRADQVSADAWIDGDYHGALTYFLWKAATQLRFSAPYAELIKRVRALLRENRYEQVPQLEGPGPLLGQPLFASFVPVGVA